VKISYREEDQKNEWANNAGRSFLNHPMATINFWMEANTLWFQVPYDSDYWDAQFKGSVNGQICPGGIDPIDITLSFGGGFIFAGDNEYQYETEQSGIGTADADLDGDVDGWNIGGDLWVRVPVSDNLTLPFLVRAEYRKKTRDGSGEASDPDSVIGFDNYDINYDHEEESLLIEAGGGIDMKLYDKSRVAAGLFYTYLDSSNDLKVKVVEPGAAPWIGVYDDETPDYKEHRISLKMGWETSLSDSTAVRAGFNTFYGFIEKDYVYDFADNGALGTQKDVASFDGHQWGIMASLGGTFRIQSVTLEPYINAGYRDLDLDGDERTSGSIISISADMDESRQEWFVGGGLSILLGN